MQSKVPVTSLKVSAYTIPTDSHEADGTAEWDSTTMILVELEGGGKMGIGYTYGNAAIAYIIDKTLKPLVLNKDVLQLSAINAALVKAVRNDGQCGIAMMAVSAIDNALWDLKAKVLNVSLSSLLGKLRDKVLIYGSGGFTSYTEKQLEEQLGRWSEVGIKHVKIKVGTHPEIESNRLRIARNTIGKEAKLYVDANGAYTIKQALDLADVLTLYNVNWFEEPVPSYNLSGLNFIRENAPSTMMIAAGEYGYNLPYFQKMLENKAVDVLQADATRCGGISGFMSTSVLCSANQLPFSSHCAPAIHVQAAMACNDFFIAEYFHDHVRIENMFFDNLAFMKDGYLQPDTSLPGIGIEFKYKDAAPYKIV